jgi:hypothetical protein
MPTKWTLDLALTSALGDDYRYDVLHAIACAFFEQAASDHDAEHKPFTVRLSAPMPTGSRLELAWLPDTPPPATVVPTTLRLGPHHVDITSFRAQKLPLASLGTGTGANRARYRAVSPAKHRHHGRDYPLPDPYLTYSGLIRRYLALDPEPVDADTIRELPRSVVVYGHDIRTQNFTWHGRRSAGFVGWVTYGLPHCSPPARRLFSTVNDLAAIAGIGHGTTHGLGAVEIDTQAGTSRSLDRNAPADDPRPSAV